MPQTLKPTLFFLCLLTAGAAMARPASPDGWYPFAPMNHHSIPNAIGMEDWNRDPAGKHGRVTAQENELIYNGRPIKLWGLNNTYGACAPEKGMADKRADLYRKFGVLNHTNPMAAIVIRNSPGTLTINSSRQSPRTSAKPTIDPRRMPEYFLPVNFTMSRSRMSSRVHLPRVGRFADFLGFEANGIGGGGGADGGNQDRKNAEKHKVSIGRGGGRGHHAHQRFICVSRTQAMARVWSAVL